MKVKINPITKEIEAEIDTQNDIALLKQLVKDNGLMPISPPEPQLTEAPQPKQDIFTEPQKQETVEQSNQMQAITEQPITEQVQPSVERISTDVEIQPVTGENAYFARTPDLSNMQKFVMVNDIYESIFHKKAPKNIVRQDPNGYYQVRDTMKALEAQGKLKHRKKKKTYLNTQSAVPTEISEPVLHPPERPMINGQMLETPKATPSKMKTPEHKGKKHPMDEYWKPLSAEWFNNTILPKLPYQFSYFDAFRAVFHYSPVGKSDDLTKSKYMRVYFPLNKLSKQKILKKEKIGKRGIVFTKIKERPYTPETETPALVWSDIPIIKQKDLEDIFQNYQSLTAPVFVGRVSRYGKKIVPNEATVIMNFLLENVQELAKLAGRKFRLTGFGQWKALEIG